MAGPEGLTRLVGRVQFTLQHWTPLSSSMAEEVLEASSLGSQLRFAVLARREESYAIWKPNDQGPNPGGRTNENSRWFGSSLLIVLVGCEWLALSYGL